MSKIGKKPIDIAGVQVTVNNNEISYIGKNHTGSYFLPVGLSARVDDSKLFIEQVSRDRSTSNEWGLHRALMACAILGAAKDFTRNLEINGLGFKAQISGSSVVFALGFTHKITMELPKEVKLTVDKTGQKLAFTSFDKEKLGHVCATVRSFRPPEPYKGTGIKYAEEIIKRKAGKAKAGSEGA